MYGDWWLDSAAGCGQILGLVGIIASWLGFVCAIQPILRAGSISLFVGAALYTAPQLPSVVIGESSSLTAIVATMTGGPSK